MYYKRIEIGFILLALACLAMMQCLDSQPKLPSKTAPHTEDTIDVKDFKTGLHYDMIWQNNTKNWKLIPKQ